MRREGSHWRDYPRSTAGSARYVRERAARPARSRASPKGERSMRNQVRGSRGERSDSSFGEGHDPELTRFGCAGADDEDAESLDTPLPGDALAEEAFDDELGEAVRLSCPDCRRPI